MPAIPIDVRSDNIPIKANAVRESSTPYALAIKRDAVQRNNAPPDILIEVPKGSEKLQILLETPTPFSKHSIVTGKVAAEELVENAVKRAGAIVRK